MNTEHAFKVGDKVKVAETYSEYWVVKAKKNTNGVIKRLENIVKYEGMKPVTIPSAVIEMSKGELLIPLSYLKPYEKTVTKRIPDLSNEELVTRFEIASAREVQMKMGTKAHQKMMKDLKEMKEEILKRMK